MSKGKYQWVEFWATCAVNSFVMACVARWLWGGQARPGPTDDPNQ